MTGLTVSLETEPVEVAQGLLAVSWIAPPTPSQWAMPLVLRMTWLYHLQSCL